MVNLTEVEDEPIDEDRDEAVDQIRISLSGYIAQNIRECKIIASLIDHEGLGVLMSYRV